MDRELTELLIKQGLIFKKTKSVDLAGIVRAKTLFALHGTDSDNYNNLVILRTAKSRLVLKDAQKLLEIANSISQNLGVRFKKFILFYSSEICSKSTAFFKENGWKCYDFS